MANKLRDLFVKYADERGITLPSDILADINEERAKALLDALKVDVNIPIYGRNRPGLVPGYAREGLILTSDKGWQKPQDAVVVQQMIGGLSTNKHSNLRGLDYASAGHTGFVSTTDAEATYLRLDTTNDPLTGALDVPEVYNSVGNLKIMPDAQGNVDLFSDTDVADNADGKIFSITRRAAEGDTTMSMFGNDDQKFHIQANNDIHIQSSIAGGEIHIGAISTNVVRLIGDMNSIGLRNYGTEDENLPLRHYGYITAGGASAQKYVQWLVDDTDDYFRLSRQSASIVGLAIEMPTSITGSITTTVPKGYAEMYMYDNVTECVIDTANIYHAIYNSFGNNDGVLAPVIDTTYFTYKAGVGYVITSFSDFNAPTSTQTKITIAGGHALLADEPITVTGTTNYDGTYLVLAAGLSATEFVITHAYAAEAGGDSVRRPATLRCLVAGSYNAGFNFSGTAGNPNDNIKIELNKDLIPLDNVVARGIWSSSTKYQSLSARGLISLTAGQYVWASVKNYSGSGNFTFYSGNVDLVRLI